MPFSELVPEATKALRDGFASRDRWLMLFVVGISVFVGLAIESLLWYLSNGDQVTNSINTAIGCGVVIGCITMILVYKWLDIDVGYAVVSDVARHAAELLEVFVVLLIASLINQGWDYGTAANVVASAVPIAIIIVIYGIFKGIRDYHIRHSAAQIQLDYNPQLTLDESLEVVDAWISHDTRVKPIYPILPSLTPSPTAVSSKTRRKRKKKTTRA